MSKRSGRKAKKRRRLGDKDQTVPPTQGRATPVPRGGARILGEIFGSHWLLGSAVVLATGLRLFHLLALRSSPWFDALQLDHAYYDEWAQRISGGQWWGGEVFFVDPLYSYFLALVYKVFGRDLFVVRLIQAVFGVGTCVVVALMGRRLFGRQLATQRACSRRYSFRQSTTNR